MSARWLLLAVSLVLVACGIPVEAEPESVEVQMPSPDEDRPPAPGEQAGVSMYLVRDETLVHVTRDLPSPPSLTIIFESLLDGVTETERMQNLRTAIPPGTETMAVTEEDSVLAIDLNSEFAAVGGEEEILAVAQIVLTATSIEGIDLVAFQLEGVPTDVPVANGALSVDPVGAAEYSTLVAP